MKKVFLFLYCWWTYEISNAQVLLQMSRRHLNVRESMIIQVGKNKKVELAHDSNGLFPERTKFGHYLVTRKNFPNELKKMISAEKETTQMMGFVNSPHEWQIIFSGQKLAFRSPSYAKVMESVLNLFLNEELKPIETVEFKIKSPMALIEVSNFSETSKVSKKTFSRKLDQLCKDKVGARKVCRFAGGLVFL
jgi:hypothetical protein